MLKWDNVCYSCLCHSLVNRCTFARSPSQKLLMNLPVSLVLFPPAALWKDPTHCGGLGCYKRVSWHHAGDLQNYLFWKVALPHRPTGFFRGSHNWNFHSPYLTLGKLEISPPLLVNDLDQAAPSKDWSAPIAASSDISDSPVQSVQRWLPIASELWTNETFISNHQPSRAHPIPKLTFSNDVQATPVVHEVHKVPPMTEGF